MAHKPGDMIRHIYDSESLGLVLAIKSKKDREDCHETVRRLLAYTCDTKIYQVHWSVPPRKGRASEEGLGGWYPDWHVLRFDAPHMNP